MAGHGLAVAQNTQPMLGDAGFSQQCVLAPHAAIHTLSKHTRHCDKWLSAFLSKTLDICPQVSNDNVGQGSIRSAAATSQRLAYAHPPADHTHLGEGGGLQASCLPQPTYTRDTEPGRGLPRPHRLTPTDSTTPVVHLAVWTMASWGPASQRVVPVAAGSRSGVEGGRRASLLAGVLHPLQSCAGAVPPVGTPHQQGKDRTDGWVRQQGMTTGKAGSHWRAQLQAAHAWQPTPTQCTHSPPRPTAPSVCSPTPLVPTANSVCSPTPLRPTANCCLLA